MAKSKEEQQKIVEEKRKLRQKQIAQLRASNEMLEEAKNTIIEHYGEDSDQAKDLLKDVDLAKDQNIERAQSYLNASKQEVETAQYNEVNPKEVEAYERRLKKRGITDEQIRQKDISGQMKDDVVSESKPQSKMEELMSKLNALNKNKAKGGTTVKGTPKITQEDKPMSDEEFAKLIANNKNNESIIDTDLKDNNKSDSNTDTVVKDKVVSIDDVNPNLAYNREKYKDYVGFDPRDIPSYVQYDVIPLPSHGECYSTKQDSLPVAYLTASDENIITSPNLYNNGSLIDIILERKILDKNVHVRDLCNGDRDAILVWLRATAYGSEYPVVATYKGKQYQTNVDLSKLKYKEFNLKGDENGYFTYKTDNGDELKFKVLSHKDEETLIDNAKKMFNETNSHDIVVYCDKIMDNISMINTDDSNEFETIVNTVNGIKEWAENISVTEGLTNEKVFNTAVTNRMIANTVSVNGNTDQEFIKHYIENMRAKEAKKYREYIGNNIPGVDFKINIDIPESDGGGSFETFLELRETLFINV